MIWRAKVCVDTLTGKVIRPEHHLREYYLFSEELWDRLPDGNSSIGMPHCKWIKVEYDDEEAR